MRWTLFTTPPSGKVNSTGRRVRAVRMSSRVLGRVPRSWVGVAAAFGVYLMHVDQSKELEAVVRGVALLSAGEWKVAGNPGGPLDSLGREDLQESVHDYHDKFVRGVARGRNKAASTVRKGFGKGGMVRAEQAVEEGMADKVNTLAGVLSGHGLSTAELTISAVSRPEAEVRRRRRKLDWTWLHTSRRARVAHFFRPK
jgi:hypothetical protein